MSNLLPPHPNVAACAGQACPERGECLRYLRPALQATQRRDGTWIVQRWSSFDIERAVFNACANKQAPFGAIARALAQAAA